MGWRARLGGLGLILFFACACTFAPAIGQDNSVEGVFDDYTDLLDERSDLPDVETSGSSGDLDPPDSDEYTSDLPDVQNGPETTSLPTEEMPPAASGAVAPQLSEPTTPAPIVANPTSRNANTQPSVEDIPAGDPLEGDSYPSDVQGQDFVGDGTSDYETIKERYPDGRVKIERGVTQDDRENYINHGPWRLWSDTGDLVAEGTYRYGKRHGRWVRVYRAEDADLFSLPPFNLFTGPFRSHADFVDGQLEGNWVISDASGNKICDWEFSAGRRHGDSLWYYHNSQTMRVIQYQDGQIHGELLEWDVDGKPLTNVEYISGRRLEKTVETFEDGNKKVEGMVLQAQLVMKKPDQWWEAKLAQYERRGKDEKHGVWKAWHPTGVPKFTGEYQFDKPAGEFTWWHPNGQKSLHAFYENGRKSGQWTWWHANGQKSIRGQYLDDSPVDRWIWWHESGKVAQRVNFSGGTAIPVEPAASSALSSQPAEFEDGATSIILNQPNN